MKNFYLIEWLWTDSHEKQRVRGMRRYAAIITLLLTMACGNVWGAETVLFSSFANSTASNYFKSYTVDSKTVGVATDQGISSSSGDYYVQLGSTPSNNNGNYVELTVTGATIKTVSVLITGNGSDKTCQPALLGWEGAIASTTTADYVLVPASQVISNKGLSNAQWHQFDVHGNDLTRVRIYRAVKGVDVAGESTSKTTYGNAQTLQFYGIRVELESSSSTYTVTYNSNGKDGGGDAPSDGNSPYASGATVTVLGNTNSMTKTGYTFDGWNTAANMSGTSYAAAGTFSISTNTTLYAKWKQTITLDDEDATTAVSPTSVTAYYNSATLPSITNPEKTGYMFAGWYTGDDGTGDLVINTSGELQATVTDYTGAGGIWTSSSARTLYAKWEEEEIEDKIVWNKNSSYGGDGKCMSAEDADLSSLTKNNNDKNDIGHSYVQISSTNTGMQRPANVDDVFTLTFTAKSGYYIKSICSYGKIEETGGAYYSWDGGSNWTNIARYASMATKTFDAPDATEPTSFIIKYTCTATDEGGMYWRNAVVTLDETAPTYTVTYDANGGTGTMTDSDSPYEAGATVAVLENEFTKPGYPFTGWSAVDEESNAIDVSSGSFTMPSSNVTITAQWGDALVDTFKDKEHGKSDKTKSGANQTTPYCEDVAAGDYCGGKHYKFIGWVLSTSVNDDGTLKNDAVIVPGKQSGWNCTGATYYAVWAAKNE